MNLYKKNYWHYMTLIIVQNPLDDTGKALSNWTIDFKAIALKVIKCLVQLLAVCFILITPLFLMWISKKGQISNLKSWNKTFRIEWRYIRKCGCHRGMYDHPYIEVKRVLNENRERYDML